ncbi:GNAT family N-acetyltransferase [Pollutimonas subterranea]|uniref:GNAT family N-acetyltransferase n=2 Tax=Pollutimonas subterranea TaxID=2045210 RepID=A0A2N4TZ33_9BURK|nr:GNAT family N-acetyltransferase [Pollutimonas subterranea]
MRRPELDLLLDWAAGEGWNPGLRDADAFFAADPEGFLIALRGDTPVAAISVVRYDDNYSFLGFYIVPPAYRGRGYGYQIWQAAMAAMGQRTIGLDGVPEQQENYRRSGFQFAHRNIRYEGQWHPAQWQNSVPGWADIVPLSAVPFAMIASYDRAFFPTSRDVFLRYWIKQPGTVALGLAANDGLSGCGIIRACRHGWKIGPLFADTAEGAQALFRALAATVTDSAPIYLDVPQCNPGAIALVENHGMKPVFETARMYTREPPDLSWLRTYGITTFELG